MANSNTETNYNSKKENESVEEQDIAQPAEKVEDEWMIRRCAVYDDEYSDCTSFKARFNQYFIFGKTLDCTQWKKDSINCYKWKDNQDLKAANELIESEKNRRKERLLPHYMNDVWEKRKAPPEDWNKPLPEYLQKEYEYTYLNVKSKEMKGEIPPSFDMNVPYCTVM
ncbi:synaptic plasticity regulator PANTS [Leptinotarsa decemlineata]|uniref:synaptic plasticity regulator PANTS n=1 Tax=Leptinotarsa decemlineata TaxID=7539 RepID=UPI000C253CD7|nr:UPF0545 protein C22orf39 homolog [Leptinotarsa decemlineata]